MMIAPGGLLLVVPHLFAIPISVLWGGVGLQKCKRTKLDVKNIFARSPTERTTDGDALRRELFYYLPTNKLSRY
jgi:hypothetical protein